MSRNATGASRALWTYKDVGLQELPDFNPYPWGRRPWIHLLVRNILLAEPLVDDFGKCFAGASPERA